MVSKVNVQNEACRNVRLMAPPYAVRCRRKAVHLPTDLVVQVEQSVPCVSVCLDNNF